MTARYTERGLQLDNSTSVAMQPRGISRKLHTPWVGPYKVVKCISETVYRIQDSRAPRKRAVHFDRLKPCSKGMRTPADVNGKEGTNSEVQQEARQLPSGTNLQIVDDYDGELDLPQGDEEAIPTQQQNNMTREDSQQRRYPLRDNRRKPARYRDGDD